MYHYCTPKSQSFQTLIFHPVFQKPEPSPCSFNEIPSLGSVFVLSLVTPSLLPLSSWFFFLPPFPVVLLRWRREKKKTDTSHDVKTKGYCLLHASYHSLQESLGVSCRGGVESPHTPFFISGLTFSLFSFLFLFLSVISSNPFIAQQTQDESKCFPPDSSFHFSSMQWLRQLFILPFIHQSPEDSHNVERGLDKTSLRQELQFPRWVA